MSRRVLLPQRVPLPVIESRNPRKLRLQNRRSYPQNFACYRIVQRRGQLDPHPGGGAPLVLLDKTG